MRPVTAAWLDTVTGSHQPVARARVVAPFQNGNNPNSIVQSAGANTYIPILDGAATTDVTADVQGSLDMVTDGSAAGQWPANSSGLITPYGNELFIESGVQYGNGTTEWCGLGYFKMDTVSQSAAPYGPISITAYDRMKTIQDAKIITPTQFGAGASFSSVVAFCLADCLPGVPITFDFDAAGTILSGSHILDDDRLGFLLDLVNSYGKVAYFDYAGVLQVKTPPSLTNPVFTVKAGRNGTLVDLSRSLSRAGVYNAVIATGQAPGQLAPVRAVAIDTDPNSPTYYYGPYGIVPTTFDSTFLTTNDQCLTAAQLKLSQSLGLPYSVDLDMSPNAALEGRDVVLVSYPDANGQRDELHILDGLKVPLTNNGSMTLTTRMQVF